MSRTIRIDVAPGELIDKLTILEIRLERIHDPDKRANIETEYALLRSAYKVGVPSSDALLALTDELRAVNQALWDIEDHIRDCERRDDFGAEFIALARAVYKTNDRRAALKREINVLLGSKLIEEKSYRPY